VWVKQSFVLDRSDYHYRPEPILYGWCEDALLWLGMGYQAIADHIVEIRPASHSVV
jgi:hypothetical protein